MFFIKRHKRDDISEEIAENTPMWRAFEEAVGILGDNMKKAMTKELAARADIDFNEPTLSLSRLHAALMSLYGDAVANMITESMIVKLDEIAEKSNN